MPDPKNNTKMTGDTHLPDTESEFSVDQANAQAAGEDRTPAARGQASERGQDNRDAGSQAGGTPGEKAGPGGSGKSRSRKA